MYMGLHEHVALKSYPRVLRCHMTYLEYEGIWRAMLFREHVLSDVLPHLNNKNDNAHKLFFTSSQNSTFSLRLCSTQRPKHYRHVIDFTMFTCKSGSVDVHCTCIQWQLLHKKLHIFILNIYWNVHATQRMHCTRLEQSVIAASVLEAWFKERTLILYK